MDMARRRRYGRIDNYLRMVERKTGSLIAGAVQGGAVMSGASAGQVEAIGRFGRHLGVAFQIIDDSLDLLGGAAANKSVMNDLKQAKATPMVVHALAKADSRDRRTIESALGNSGMTAQIAARVMAIYRKHDAIAYAQRLSHEYVVRGRDELATLPAGDARDRFGAILDVLDYWSLSRG
jgi:geranylgeranyl pyrophosphate synthase